MTPQTPIDVDAPEQAINRTALKYWLSMNHQLFDERVSARRPVWMEEYERASPVWLVIDVILVFRSSIALYLALRDPNFLVPNTTFRQMSGQRLQSGDKTYLPKQLPRAVYTPPSS